MKLKVSRRETKCFMLWNEVFHTEKRIVSSSETIFETNRCRWRGGELVALHPQTLYSSKIQRKGERGRGKIENKYPVANFIRFCTVLEMHILTVSDMEWKMAIYLTRKSCSGATPANKAIRHHWLLIPFVGYIDPTYWVYNSNSSSISDWQLGY